jgi:hypothetical protein
MSQMTDTEAKHVAFSEEVERVRLQEEIDLAISRGRILATDTSPE